MGSGVTREGREGGEGEAPRFTHARAANTILAAPRLLRKKNTSSARSDTLQRLGAV